MTNDEQEAGVGRHWLPSGQLNVDSALFRSRNSPKAQRARTRRLHSRLRHKLRENRASLLKGSGCVASSSPRECQGSQFISLASVESSDHRVALTFSTLCSTVLAVIQHDGNRSDCQSFIESPTLVGSCSSFVILLNARFDSRIPSFSFQTFMDGEPVALFSWVGARREGE